MNPTDPLSAVVSQLSKEAAQDAAAKTNVNSYLAGANAGMIRSRELEFSDSEKQWVRSNVWLKTAEAIAAFNNHKLRYLTLPAYYRLDVSLFDRRGLLREGVNATGQRVLDVAAFEKDPAKFGRMSSQIPTFKLLGQCGVEEAITDDKNPYFRQLAEMFPFDLVNLDLTSSLTPKKEGPYSTIMQALDQILRRQRDQIGRWALFLTFRNVPPDWEPNAVDQLAANLQDNIGRHPEIREAFRKRYAGVLSVKDLWSKNESECLSQSVVKWVTDRAHQQYLRLVDLDVYYYTRYPSGVPKYMITKHVYTFERGAVGKSDLPTKVVPEEVWMIDDLVSCISKHKADDVEQILYRKEYAKPGSVSELQKDIDSLVGSLEADNSAQEQRVEPST